MSYEITGAQLRAIIPTAGAQTIQTYLAPLNRFMAETGIADDVRRVRHFLAQVAHETGGLRYTEEIASGKAYDTGRKAVQLGNTPEADGDGQQFKGRGLLMVTGRKNYAAYSRWVGYDFVSTAARRAQLTKPGNAARSACWYFTEGAGTNLCLIADTDDGTNTEAVLRKITRKINGGLNGLADRRAYLERAVKSLG